MQNINELPDGFYLIRNPQDPQTSLVKLYDHPEFNGIRHVVFGAWDGGGFVSIDDLADGTSLVPVLILPSSLPPTNDLDEAPRYTSEMSISRMSDELERERMRLAACGVVALADTPESAARARDINPAFMSASFADVSRLVDKMMKYRDALQDLREDFRRDDPRVNSGIIAHITKVLE
jgi:hypothetical protein